MGKDIVTVESLIRQIANVGITPDEVVVLSDEANSALYLGALSEADDTQLQAAIARLTDGK